MANPTGKHRVEPGVDHLDTAQFYGPDDANELIHEALQLPRRPAVGLKGRNPTRRRR